MKRLFLVLVFLVATVALVWATENRDSMTYTGTHAVTGTTTLSGAVTQSGLTTFSGGVLNTVEIITTGGANVITSAECGNIIVDKDATPATTHTLPANATAGCTLTFINGINQTANDTITAATADTIDGVLTVNGAGVQCSLADVVNIINTADVIGDYVVFVSDGTKWYVSGTGFASGAITCTG